ncbi:MAG: S41 family peptidase [Endomicrobium sp.]|nr:S41 family peptidase [Endomicrobium sp.]
MKFWEKVTCASMLVVFCATNIFASNDEMCDRLRLLIDVMDLINTNYVSETNPKDLVVGAIKGVVATLDPFSQYMEEKAYRNMKNETRGSYNGIGLRIMIRNDFLTIVSPLPDSPAYRAGVLPEDRIFKIDGKCTAGMSSSEAINLMRGKAGKKVKITILRDNLPGELEFNLVREKIKIETVKAIMLDDDIVYIRLKEFNAQSAGDIKKVLTNYQKQGIKALILDLRNNPGGLLDSAINIISMFIKDRKLALTTRGKIAEIKKEYFTTGDGEFSDLPIVILINKGSASASEILSGVMQDFKRALIIGSNTFGKGNIQTVLPLPGRTALKLTVAKYYLPSGRSINGFDNNNAKNGITPDIEIKIGMEDEIKLYMQGEIISASNKDYKSIVDMEKKVEDKVLNKALEIIRENKVIEKIKLSTALTDLKK